MGRVTPVSASAAWLMDVSTVMPSVTGTSKPYSAAARSAPFCAALIMATPPTVCMVIMSAPEAAAEYAAPSTWCGMSWNFRSKNTLKPRSFSAYTTAGPLA